MNNTAVLEALSNLRGPGDPVYSLTRTKKRNPLVEFLDVVVSGGALTGAAEVADAFSAPLFLIDGQEKATIVQVRDGKVVETLDVPGWSPDRGARLKSKGPSLLSLDVAGYRYRKVAQLA